MATHCIEISQRSGLASFACIIGASFTSLREKRKAQVHIGSCLSLNASIALEWVIFYAKTPPPHRAFANIESLKPRARERTVPSTYTIRPFEPTAAYIRHPGIRRLAGNYPHRPGRCQSHIRSFHCPSNDGFRVEVTEIRMYTGTHTETRKVHCSSHRASRHTYHCPRAYHILLRKY